MGKMSLLESPWVLGGGGCCEKGGENIEKRLKYLIFLVHSEDISDRHSQTDRNSLTYAVKALLPLYLQFC